MALVEIQNIIKRHRKDIFLTVPAFARSAAKNRHCRRVKVLENIAGRLEITRLLASDNPPHTFSREDEYLLMKDGRIVQGVPH